MKKHYANGTVIYEGPSLLNGEPIVGIINGLVRPSENRKTGPQLQVYILPAHTPPSASVKDGSDKSVCGDCPMRPVNSGSCYVLPFQGPNRVWQSWKAGKYLEGWDRVHPSMPLRVSAWGDPAALPDFILERMLQNPTTGYTHQWARFPHREMLQKLCMASCETLQEAVEAAGLGWRTFRIRLPGESSSVKEVACPAASGQGIQCFTCQLCAGTSVRGKSVSIEIHGSAPKLKGYKELRAA